MKSHQLRGVLAVAEHDSLRVAARRLGIAQPAFTWHRFTAFGGYLRAPDVPVDDGMAQRMLRGK